LLFIAHWIKLHRVYFARRPWKIETTHQGVATHCSRTMVLTNFSAFSESKLFLMMYHAKSYIEKTQCTDAELAGHIHKLDVKLQSLCVIGFSLFAVSIFAKPLHLSELTNNTLRNKDGVHFFTLKFECHNRYNKLLVRNSASGDIAWCNKNNSQFTMGFLRFSSKRTKTCFFKENKKPGYKKAKNGFFSTLIISFNPFCDFPLIARTGASHYQFDWMCATHLEEKSLVMKNLITVGIWIRKN